MEEVEFVLECEAVVEPVAGVGGIGMWSYCLRLARRSEEAEGDPETIEATDTGDEKSCARVAESGVANCICCGVWSCR